ncbi:MAG: short-chain dehydrogenase [Planctomycetes bacterium GWF2_41_51]|nr:MAG: short-chain dehydrogenase [Planctomycetes bacterium GWF2_41_51]HBG26096.1 short-chain dehydrogenase [Phycisphaerales bacterium]
MHVNELLSLKNKVCLITGGEGKYGRCITEALAEAGGKVITVSPFVNDANKVVNEMKNNAPLDITVMYVDQTNHDSIIKLKEEIKAKFGRLDVFVNNAVLRPMKTYTSPLEQFSESMRVNATGMFDITREMADLIGQSGGGSIVNICSMMGMFGPDLSNYEGTGWDVPPPDYFFHKGGIFTLTRYLCRVLAVKKVRVNSISPGGIFANQHEQFLKNYTKKVPAGRLANNDDIKGVVVFLASQASAYINGENILMDGGMHS